MVIRHGEYWAKITKAPRRKMYCYRIYLGETAQPFAEGQAFDVSEAAQQAQKIIALRLRHDAEERARQEEALDRAG